MEMAPKQSEHVVTLPQSDVMVAVLTMEFNVVYQLSHLYRHIFDDGLGLRQVLDYYFVLKSQNGITPDNVILNEVKDLGMHRFACALMYVLREVFGLEKKYFVCEADREAGEFLLQ